MDGGGFAGRDVTSRPAREGAGDNSGPIAELKNGTAVDATRHRRGQSGLFRPETFRTSRLLDFCGERELTAQIGHEPGWWPACIVKELVDNALDAAEEAGVPPQVRVTATDKMIEVVDAGPGIPGDVIDDILDFDMRVSSREAYVGPTRGAQGNALKTIVLMAFALDGRAGLVEIRSRGIRHSIQIGIDPIAQRPTIEITRAPSLVRTGTSVRIHWASSPRWKSALAGQLQSIAFAAARFALFNPHLRVNARVRGTFLRFGHIWEPTDRAWGRWRPSDPPVAAWYDLDRFVRLLCALLHADRQAGRVRLVRDFMADFRGLSGTAKRKSIIAELDLARASLENLLTAEGAPDRERIAKLLEAMQAAGTAPKSSVLGVVGREHMLECLHLSDAAAESFEYRRIVDDDPAPRITEVAFTYDPDLPARHVYCGVNNSPSVQGATAFRQIGSSNGLGDLLEHHAVQAVHPVAFVLHHAGARLTFADRGKAALSIKGQHGAEVERAVLKVAEPWFRQHEREIRNSRASLRRAEVFAKRSAVSQKDAAAECMVAAYLKASSNGTLPVAPRQIYYAARAHIEEKSGKALDSKYFSQTLLVDYMAENPKQTASWDIAWDARGNLAEPHSGRTIPLSTLAVREYVEQKGWRHKFGTALFCEKEGFQPLFQAVKLGERYDMAIMSTKGTSVTAARTLIDAMVADGVQVLCIRDFDFAGFNIAATLAQDTRRHAWNTAGAIDLGLRLADVRTWELSGERVHYKNGKHVLTDPGAIRAKIAQPLRSWGATDAEIDFLRTHRVELNEFASGDLVKWIEAKLGEHGVAKVLPDGATLVSAAYTEARAQVVKRILAEMEQEIDRRVDQIPLDGAALAERIRRKFDVERTLSWRDALVGLVRDDAQRSGWQP